LSFVIVELRVKTIHLLITLSLIAMVQFWRTAGISFIRYVNICSKVLRSCLKEEHRKAAQIRDFEKIKFRTWSDGKKGKLEEMKPVDSAEN
jgi:F-type H+-transporting ATPase subunit epsilon